MTAAFTARAKTMLPQAMRRVWPAMSRAVGTALSEIKKIPNKMVAAVGIDKVPAVLAALEGGMVDKLYIDQPAAAEIMRRKTAQKKSDPI